MSHEVETMAWAHEVPWHGLGVNIDPKESLENWMHMSGLDWTVSKRQLLANVAGAQIEVPDHFALVRDTDNSVMDVVGRDWKPVNNKDAIEFFRSFTDSNGASMETMGSLRGGRIVWGLASLNDKFSVAGKTDKVKGYLLLMSPHLLGRSLLARVTGVRVVCANTLAMATAGTAAIERRFAHSKAFDPKVAAEAMGLIREEFVKFGTLSNQLAKLNLSNKEMLNILAPIFDGIKPDDFNVDDYDPSPRVTKVMSCVNGAPGAQPGTGWGLLNGVTYWADHVAGRNPDSRLASAWTGSAADRKVKVMRQLEAMVA